MTKTNAVIVRAGEIRGYHEDKLPVRAGDTVEIPKGTIISRTFQGERRAKKKYTVKVHHTLPGSMREIGTYWPDKGEFHLNRIEGKYLEPFQRVYGTSNLMDLIFYAVIRETKTYTGVTYHHVYLPIENPKVRWAGSASYWMEADINDVRKV